MSVSARIELYGPVPRADAFRCIASIPLIAIVARWGRLRATCDIDCIGALERLAREKHDEIAAVIVEPLLQGAGGMIVHPVEFLQRVRKLCSEHDVLLIADEVLTGFGRMRKDVRVRIGERGAGPDVSFEGTDGRSASHGRDGLHRARFTARS